MKQSLQLRTSQHLALTPQLQQSIRLLQLSTLELHQELEQLLGDNPMLERLDDPLDHSVRLLADGAISQGNGNGAEAPVAPAPDGAAPGEGGDAPAAASEGEAYEGGDSESAANGSDDADWSASSGSKSSDDEDSRPQLEASGCTLREHLLEQMR